jgi:hypothetical protein
MPAVRLKMTGERQATYRYWSAHRSLHIGMLTAVLNKTKLRGFGPRANYTDRATAACWRKLVPPFSNRGCRVVSATDSDGR